MSQNRQPIAAIGWIAYGVFTLIIYTTSGSIGAFILLVFLIAVSLLARELQRQQRQKHQRLLGSYQPHPSATKGRNRPYAGRKDESRRRKYYPVNGDNQVTPFAKPDGHPEIPERIIEQIARMNLDRATAIRLLEGTSERNPGQDWGWVAEKVIFDLERDRGRA